MKKTNPLLKTCRKKRKQNKKYKFKMFSIHACKYEHNYSKGMKTSPRLCLLPKWNRPNSLQNKAHAQTLAHGTGTYSLCHRTGVQTSNSLPVSVTPRGVFYQVQNETRCEEKLGFWSLFNGEGEIKATIARERSARIMANTWACNTGTLLSHKRGLRRSQNRHGTIVHLQRGKKTFLI